MRPVVPLIEQSTGATGTVAPTPGVLLMFRQGQRPDRHMIIKALDSAGARARISFKPDAENDGCLELLSGGLTFDLAGLKPAGSIDRCAFQQSFGFDDEIDYSLLEAVSLVPSDHIIAGFGSEAVLRIMLALVADIALKLPVCGVVWKWAGTIMEPHFFSRIVLAWLSGGAFPALGLTALMLTPDGSIVSRGLSLFTGQEIQLEGMLGEQDADTRKLAVRVIDQLVRHGPIDTPMILRVTTGNQGEYSEVIRLAAEPSKIGNLLLLWRQNL